jgi:hypothetical protein
VYSGISHCFLDDTKTPPENNIFRITLTGSIYSSAVLDDFVSGLAAWLDRRKGNGMPEVEFVYAGSDTEMVRPALERLDGLARVLAHPYLPLADLAVLCRSASLNAYLWTPKNFHHKLLELLACGRPVIAFPGEWDESKRLATSCNGELYICTKFEQVIYALDTVLIRNVPQTTVRPDVNSFTWSAQAAILEETLLQAVAQTN